MQIVLFNFDDNYPGSVTFNLLPGPYSNSVIIQCQFNTPKLAKIDSAMVARLGPSIGIKSIKIGSNNPVPFAF